MSSSTARKYGDALIEVALESNEEEQALDALRQFASVLEESSDLQETLENPGIPLTIKQKIVREVVSRLDCPGIVLNFLLILLERNRLLQVEEVLAAYQEVLDESRGVVRIDVFSAHTLPSEVRSRLRDTMSQATGREVRLSYQVDEGLIGGVRIQMGSVVYDGTVYTQLEQIRGKLAVG